MCIRDRSSSIDITTNSNFSPLLCVYRKSSANFIHSKNSNGFDEDSFKKEINPSTNALMTLCLLELLDYYLSLIHIFLTSLDFILLICKLLHNKFIAYFFSYIAISAIYPKYILFFSI